MKNPLPRFALLAAILITAQSAQARDARVTTDALSHSGTRSNFCVAGIVYKILDQVGYTDEARIHAAVQPAGDLAFRTYDSPVRSRTSNPGDTIGRLAAVARPVALSGWIKLSGREVPVTGEIVVAFDSGFAQAGFRDTGAAVGCKGLLEPKGTSQSSSGWGWAVTLKLRQSDGRLLVDRPFLAY